jgi:osmoprotectant transport system ATP-binding protein
MIRVQNLRRVFASKTVLDGVSYSFAPDKTHIILGSSGSGKSTLLRLVLGLIEPTEGEVWIDSERMSPESRLKLTRQMGYVVQEGGLFPHLNSHENVALVAKTLGWSADKIRDRVSELCELAGLEVSLLQRLPRELSGGQRQRVGLIRALMLDPKILLLDEPLGALDPMIRSGLQEQLKTLFNRLRKTVLLVTHDLTEAAYLGDSILLLNDGKIVQTGSFSDLINEPKTPFVREFISAQRLLIPDRAAGRVA